MTLAEASSNRFDIGMYNVFEADVREGGSGACRRSAVPAEWWSMSRSPIPVEEYRSWQMGYLLRGLIGCDLMAATAAGVVLSRLGWRREQEAKKVR
jgi:hypothetical protein